MIPQNQKQKLVNQALDQLSSKGLKLIELKQFTQALNMFEQVLAEQPRHFFALSFKGYCLCQMNRLTEGMDCINQSLQINPDFETGYNMIGEILIQQGKFYEAQQLLQKYLQRNPKSSLAYTLLGQISLDNQRLPECLQWSDKAIQIDPSCPSPYINKSLALINLNRIQEALQMLSIAERLNSNLPQIYINRAMCLILMKQFQEAIIQCDKGINLNPNFELGYLNKGNKIYNYFLAGALLYLNNQQESYKFALHANKLNPKIHQPYIIIGLIQISQKLFDQALATCNQGLTYHPKNKQILSIKRQALKSLNRLNEAKQLEQQYKKDFPAEELQDLIDFVGDVGNIVQGFSNNQTHNSSDLGWQLLDLIFK